VRRISSPLARHPERFHQDRSDIAKAICDLARRVSPLSRPTPAISVDLERGRIVTASRTIKGRRIVVQRRRPFAIFVETARVCDGE
jgi:hypothetical protein